MGYVRVKKPPCAVRHPEHGELVVPNPAQAYRDDDPLVRAYPWLFQADVDMPDPNRVESARSAPGDRRDYRPRR